MSSNLSRRQLLTFFGASAGAVVFSDVIGKSPFNFGGNSAIAQSIPLSFTSLRLPSPLPIYREQPSFLPTGLNGQGQAIAAGITQLSQYNVIDDVVVPPEYERYTIVAWGDRVFPNQDDYFGYNADYTGYIPINGNNEGWLGVNHEYVGFPLSGLAPEAPSDVVTLPTSFSPVIGYDLPTSKNRELYGEFLYNMGFSFVRIRKDSNSRFVVVRDNGNRRVHALSGLGINSQRTDSYRNVTAWGTRSHQIGDQNFLIGTGAAASEVFERVNADGLGNRIIGTGYNCSGETTPWGTILSCEENYQAGGEFFVGVQEEVLPNGSQTGYAAGTSGEEFGLVGEKYGWTVELDPDASFRPRKHTALGRFRHENSPVRAEAGKPLIVYQGDDRRGGHTWKYISTGRINNINDKSNSRLFESGILYAARFNSDGTGVWIPLLLSTSTNPIKPSELAAAPLAANLTGSLIAGRIKLPRRNGIAGQTRDGGAFNLERDSESLISEYQGKTLANFYTSQGAILVDAFLAANLVGATPGARPEDIEVNPRNPNEVFIAYTDGAPGSDGYPDSRIFHVAKLTANVDAEQQSGALFKIIEDGDGTGTTFRWERLEQGGEAGAAQGAGFGNLDNLAFDNQGNVWGVTDMSTSTHNGFDVGAAGRLNTINHTAVGNTSSFTGVFGNNWLFYIPTSGNSAGQVIPFAYGPVRSEMTGPTFVGGDTLLLSVQHPGEDCPFSPRQTLSRSIEMLDLDGSLFTQQRTVSRGSNWPSNIQGNPEGAPKPTVIGIRRRSPSGTFV